MSKYLVIGLGSMGKRRVRCLRALGVEACDIWGMDAREDRRREAHDQYGISIGEKEGEIDFSQVEAVIVSLPPDKHWIGVDIAVRHRKPVFVEASVMLEETRAIEVQSREIFVAPSCTFVFHPMIQEIKRILDGGEYGRVCNFSYHSGQYLPDWHPWENVRDFYVSRRETGGAREIVPYELSWITNLFGFPEGIKGYYRKTGDTGCDIEDSYGASLDYGGMIGTLLVDVVSRYPARNLIINFEQGQIQWRWDREQLEVYDARSGSWEYRAQVRQDHQEGYSAMIGENMYVEEIRAFLEGTKDAAVYPNTLEKDIHVLELLNCIEESDGSFARGLR